MTTHTGSQTVILDIETQQDNTDRVVARLADGTPVGEKDVFSLQEGESIAIRPKDHGFYDSGGLAGPRKPRARLQALYIWQSDQEKKIENAIKFEKLTWNPGRVFYGALLYSENGRLVREPTTPGNSPDVEVGTLATGINLLHRAGSNAHAHYQFSVRLAVDPKTAIWDPDVHDEAPHR